MNKTAEYLQGFKAGREAAEGFHKGTMNQRERRLHILSPYMGVLEATKATDFRRGALDGNTDYWKDKEGIAPAGVRF